MRKARLSDAQQIEEIINHFAQRELILPRSINSIYENIRDFWLEEDAGEIIGVSSLHIQWQDLAEIRSLVVREEYQHRGVGSRLLLVSIEEARGMGIKRVFSLTYIPDFFLKYGFVPIDKGCLPEKVWKECVYCVKYNRCDEKAVLRYIG